MKNSILNLGKTLNKKEQQTINGGKVDCIGYVSGNKVCIDFGLKCAQIQCQF